MYFGAKFLDIWRHTIPKVKVKNIMTSQTLLTNQITHFVEGQLLAFRNAAFWLAANFWRRASQFFPIKKQNKKGQKWTKKNKMAAKKDP